MTLSKVYHRILLHEWLWMLMLSIILVRSIIHASFLWASFALLCLIAVVINTKAQNRIIRFMFYFVLMNILFVLLKYISPAINPDGKKDALLYQWDCALFGDFVGLFTNSFAPLWLSEILALAYLLFFPELLFFSIYALRKKDLCEKFFVGLMSLYAIGFIGYIFVPAIGPYDFLASKFTHNLEGYFFFDALQENYAKGSNLTDVFPSLHCGVSCFILLFSGKYAAKLFKICLIPTILLWISTVYLHYHYLVDCLVGILLAILCFLIILMRKNKCSY